MWSAEFEYLRPASVQEAARLLRERRGEAKLLAGGHSLVPLMKLRLSTPRYLVDIGRIDGLAYIRQEGNVLAIGALTTHQAIESSELVGRVAPLLAEAAGQIGDVQVRNRGTIGGSLAHADPGGDLPAAVLALEATLRAVGPSAERTIAAGDFFVDLLTTALAEDEILTEIRVPIPAGRVGSAYLKFENPASHYALVGVAAVLTLGDDGKIAQARVGITGVGPKAYRATGVEQALVGRAAEASTFAEAAQAAVASVDVSGDLHASSDYRAHLTTVFTSRALSQAAARAQAG